MYDTATPRLAAFAILRRGNTVAFVLRSNTNWMNGFYGLPAGKVEKKEQATAAAIREAKEEVGITITESDLQHALTVHRMGEDGSDWVDVLFEIKNWEGEPFNAEPHMHGELAWLDLDNLPENIVPAVRFYMEQIKVGTKYAEYGWNA